LGFCCLCASLLFVFSVFSPVAMGQAANTGTVSGTVSDQSGAAVVGAAVALVDTATGTERTAVTNDTGRYLFANIVPGIYNVTISKSGFREQCSRRDIFPYRWSRLFVPCRSRCQPMP